MKRPIIIFAARISARTKPANGGGIFFFSQNSIQHVKAFQTKQVFGNSYFCSKVTARQTHGIFIQITKKGKLNLVGLIK